MKKILVRNILVLAMSCVALFCMFLPLLTLNGYFKGTSNGFSCLSFSDPVMDSFAPVCGVIMLLTLGTIITAIVFAILNLVTSNTAKGRTVLVSVLIGSASFVYSVVGIVSMVVAGGGSTLAPLFLVFVIGFIIPIIILTVKAEPKGTGYAVKQGIESVIPTAQTQTATTYVPQQNAPQQSVPAQAPATAVSTEDGAIYVMEGEAKTLKVYDEYVVIVSRKNARSFLTGNFFGGEKKVYYENMIGVQFKPSSAMILGYIQIEMANTFSKDNFNSEGSVTFSHLKVPNEVAKQIADFIDKKLHESKQPKATIVQQAPVSKADELLKYKALLDQGVISQEEFDKKKQELL